MAPPPNGSLQLEDHVSVLNELSLPFQSHGLELDDWKQDIALAILSRPPMSADSPKGLLWTIGKRIAARRALREQARLEKEGQFARLDKVQSTLELLAERSMRRYLKKQVNLLEEPYRFAVHGRYIDQACYLSLAEQSGLTEAAVRQHVARGLALLRVRLESRRVDFSFGAFGFLLLFLGSPIRRRLAVVLPLFAVLAAVLFLESPSPDGALEASSADSFMTSPDFAGLRETGQDRVGLGARIHSNSGVQELSKFGTAGLENAIQVLVLNPQGLPLENARVLRGSPANGPYQFVGFSDLHGLLSVPRIGEDAIWASSPDFNLSFVRSLSNAPAGRAFELSLRPMARFLTVSVVDQSGAAVSAAQVEFGERLGGEHVSQSGAIRYLGPKRRGVTDANGRFESSMGAGSARKNTVWVKAPGYAQGWAMPTIVSRDIPAGSGAHYGAHLVLQPPSQLMGRVLYPNGDLAPGAHVKLVHNDVNVGNAIADARGEFAIGDLPGMNYRALITLSSPGESVFYSVQSSLAASQTLSRDFIIPHGTTLRGLALDLNGQPAVGAKIIRRFAGTSHSQTRVCTTDENGHFSFQDFRTRKSTISMVGRSKSVGSEHEILTGSIVDVVSGEELLLREIPRNSRVHGRIELPDFPLNAIPRIIIRGAQLLGALELAVDTKTGLWQSPALVAGEYGISLRTHELGEEFVLRQELEPNSTLDLGRLVPSVGSDINVHLNFEPKAGSLVLLQSGLDTKGIALPYRFSGKLPSQTSSIQMTQDGFIIKNAPRRSLTLNIMSPRSHSKVAVPFSPDVPREVFIYENEDALISLNVFFPRNLEAGETVWVEIDAQDNKQLLDVKWRVTSTNYRIKFKKPDSAFSIRVLSSSGLEGRLDISEDRLIIDSIYGCNME